jgi:DNA-binding transcriptional ArsR family regulator
MTRLFDDRFLSMLVERLHAIADPTRIRILTFLEQREASFQELADELGASTTHQNASKHLLVLYSAGIVTRRRAGNRVFCAIADYTACLLIRDAIASLVAHVEEPAEVVRLEP